ncbi:ROK family transcriptional regulator [Georgenia sp. TF02-10]|uniref:ROK family transcriptional regulator n=1 Tax=Georgenia sp. TF02-10 TaxID=2917725 RepID=UPI001FA803D0|nr:ROK family transcriptional regulator [Georgenia sp. TF02-10]UNX55320.1 ROK family transcriptional regulator [Georgenia sp. TF02-10]
MATVPRAPGAPADATGSPDGATRPAGADRFARSPDGASRFGASPDGTTAFGGSPDGATRVPDPTSAAAGNGAGAPGVRPSGAGAIFQHLRDGRPRTRADLAAFTGLARSTVAARVEELLAVGLLAPTGEAASTGGRPPATFAFNPGARLVLAVDLGASHARVAVTDLAARVLAEEDLPLRIADGPEPVLSRVSAVAVALVGRVGRPMTDVVGLGMGLPGPVEHVSGRPTNPPIMPNWDGFDVPGRLRAEFPVPVLIDNDVNIMALGEHTAVWPDVADLLFVKVASGIGAGIISAGRLQRGAQGAAGDLGHVAVPGGPQVRCRCGNVGCLEAVASGPAIAARLRELGLPATGSADVVDLVRRGDVEAGLAVRQAGREIGDVLAACVSLLNPSVIVIGGAVAAVGEQLLAGIREAVYRRSLPLATQHLRVVGARTEGRAGVLGAAALVAQHVLAPAQVDAAVAAA